MLAFLLAALAASVTIVAGAAAAIVCNFVHISVDDVDVGVVPLAVRRRGCNGNPLFSLKLH